MWSLIGVELNAPEIPEIAPVRWYDPGVMQPGVLRRVPTDPVREFPNNRPEDMKSLRKVDPTCSQNIVP